jgi:hypothetical protein
VHGEKYDPKIQNFDDVLERIEWVD